MNGLGHVICTNNDGELMAWKEICEFNKCQFDGIFVDVVIIADTKIFSKCRCATGILAIQILKVFGADVSTIAIKMCQQMEQSSLRSLKCFDIVSSFGSDC